MYVQVGQVAYKVVEYVVVRVCVFGNIQHSPVPLTELKATLANNDAHC